VAQAAPSKTYNLVTTKEKQIHPNKYNITLNKNPENLIKTIVKVCRIFLTTPDAIHDYANFNF